MNIRPNLDELACLTPADWQWVPSPQPGVERVLLDRVGDEVAVATSFVRYAPGSAFPPHQHARGEEFIVLDGEFGDEHGRFGPGSYVRNPPGSRHAPFSEPGCLIWVKLRQFQPDDGETVRARLDLETPASGTVDRLIHAHGEEQAAVIALAPGAVLEKPGQSVPQEVLVLAGAVATGEGQTLDRWSWLRLPPATPLALTACTPARIFWKTRPRLDGWEDATTRESANVEERTHAER